MNIKGHYSEMKTAEEGRGGEESRGKLKMMIIMKRKRIEEMTKKVREHIYKRTLRDEDGGGGQTGGGPSRGKLKRRTKRTGGENKVDVR